MLTLHDYDFNWRTPDPRVLDTIAYFEIPQDVNYLLRAGTEFKVIVPAKASVSVASDGSVTTSVDVTNATISGTGIKILTFKLPHFLLSPYYAPNELVQVIKLTGGSYTTLTYKPNPSNANEWGYDATTKTFTVVLGTSVSAAEFRVYYAPIGGTIKIVHKITGGIKTEVVCANTSTNSHVLFTPGKMTPRISKDEILQSRTFLEIQVLPRTIAGVALYSFDPLLPDGSYSSVCLVELPLERI